VSTADVNAVFARRKRYWENGYRPLEIWNAEATATDAGEPLNSPGKQPRGQWRRLAARNPPAAASHTPDQRALNTGLLCGEIIGIDVDVLIPELVDEIVHLVELRLGTTPLTRIGKPPKILLVYRAAAPFSKLVTPELLLDGTKVKVEILAEGQQFVADGIHPDTHEPYTWTGACSPEDVRIDDLPVGTEEQARAISGEIESLLHGHGAVDEKSRRQPRLQNSGPSNFFAQVNAAALRNAGSWARRIFPTAKYQMQTGAWRVSSKDLGRNLEEDLSIHPIGICDFGEEKPLTPIDLVMQYEGIDSPRQAALRLCDYIHIAPDTLGYIAEKPQLNGHDRDDTVAIDDLTDDLNVQATPQGAKEAIAGGIRAIIVEAGKRHIAADQGIVALVAANVPLYQRNRKIIRIALVRAKTSSGETIMVPGIVTLEQPMMERELGRSAVWKRWDGRKKEYAVIDPPSPVAAQILAMAGHWPFPPLHGIIQCPTLRADGSLLDRPGYDRQTGLVLVDGVKMQPISPRPSRRQAEDALDLLLGLLSEFPFTDDESQAVALSMLITPVIRGAMPVAPMHLVTAPLPGTGKSYLLDCASMIATGEVCAVESMAPRYEETEKRLIGAALSGFPMIAVDNVREIVAGDFFCQVVERPLMSLRALGSSDKHRIPNTFTVFANGNNATVAEDMVRRTLRCELDANQEHPEERTFSYDPLATVSRDRGKYIGAALTIPLAYAAAGYPKQKTPLASFGGWCRLVRDPLTWLGCADPVASQTSLRTEDPCKTDLADVFDEWRAVLGTDGQRYRTSEIVKAAGENENLRDALLKVANTRRQTGTAPEISNRALGGWLRKHQGQIARGLKLKADRSDAARPKWYLEVCSPM
jgi:hypothetical protein